jgi:hypothetical protein
MYDGLVLFCLHGGQDNGCKKKKKVIAVWKPIFLTPFYLFVHQLLFQQVYNNEATACHIGM